MAASLQSVDNLKDSLEKKDTLVVLNFWAAWAHPCKQLNKIFDTLAKKYASVTNVKLFKVDADDCEDLVDLCKVEAVPSFVVLRGDTNAEDGVTIVERVDGANAAALTAMVQKHTDASSGGAERAAALSALDTAELNARLEKLVNYAPIMLFMKGEPDEPRCGFSRTIVGLLQKYTSDFQSFDILSDETVRQGLKAFSKWPTYPQLYVNGELIGGLDIVKEMDEAGELKPLLEGAAEARVAKLNERLRTLIESAKVMLFMKGTPANPQCGFSAKIVDILNGTNVPYSTFNILEDNAVRQGLKSYSNWPTFPQLYVNGDLIGGLDIVKEMNESGELIDELKK